MGLQPLPLGCSRNLEKLIKFLEFNYKIYHFLRILGCEDIAVRLIRRVNEKSLAYLTSTEEIAVLVENENESSDSYMVWSNSLILNL